MGLLYHGFVTFLRGFGYKGRSRVKPGMTKMRPGMTEQKPHKINLNVDYQKMFVKNCNIWLDFTIEIVYTEYVRNKLQKVTSLYNLHSIKLSKNVTSGANCRKINV